MSPLRHLSTPIGLWLMSVLAIGALGGEDAFASYIFGSVVSVILYQEHKRK